VDAAFCRVLSATQTLQGPGQRLVVALTLGNAATIQSVAQELTNAAATLQADVNTIGTWEPGRELATRVTALVARVSGPLSLLATDPSNRAAASEVLSALPEVLAINSLATPLLATYPTLAC
jgi:hypothetical protein